MITKPIYLPNVTVTTISDYGGIDLDIDNDGILYVAENNRFEVFKITPDGTRTTLLSTVNDTNRGAPMGITVDIDGNVYATVSILKNCKIAPFCHPAELVWRSYRINIYIINH